MRMRVCLGANGMWNEEYPVTTYISKNGSPNSSWHGGAGLFTLDTQAMERRAAGKREGRTGKLFHLAQRRCSVASCLCVQYLQIELGHAVLHASLFAMPIARGEGDFLGVCCGPNGHSIAQDPIPTPAGRRGGRGRGAAEGVGMTYGRRPPMAPRVVECTTSPPSPVGSSVPL